MRNVIELRGWRPPSLNELMRMHFRIYMKLKADLLELMKPLVRGVDPPLPCRVVCTRFGLKLMDLDNLGCTPKAPFDVLRELGVIPDDDPSVIAQLTTLQELVDHRVDQGFRLEFFRVVAPTIQFPHLPCSD